MAMFSVDLSKITRNDRIAIWLVTLFAFFTPSITVIYIFYPGILKINNWIILFFLMPLFTLPIFIFNYWLALVFFEDRDDYYKQVLMSHDEDIQKWYPTENIAFLKQYFKGALDCSKESYYAGVLLYTSLFTSFSFYTSLAMYLFCKVPLQNVVLSILLFELFLFIAVTVLYAHDRSMFAQGGENKVVENGTTKHDINGQ
jgi:hypothetical protein